MFKQIIEYIVCNMNGEAVHIIRQLAAINRWMKQIGKNSSN
jgi:hypothetical protein